MNKSVSKRRAARRIKGEAAKAAKHRTGAVPNAAPGTDVPIDWSATPEIDPARLETGLYKFAGSNENRAQDRISQRELGLVDIAVRFPGNGKWTPVKLWDFTSISFGILHQPVAAAWPAPAGMEQTLSDSERAAMPAPAAPIAAAAVGDEVEVRLRIHGHAEFTAWCSVKNIAPNRDGLKLGLRRLDLAFPQAVDVERREAFRLPIAPTLAMKARIKHPFLYGHWCMVNVSDVNKDMGLSFACDDPAILLFEGMELKVHFELASFRGMPMTARVTWVHATAANQVRFGAAYLDMAWKLHNGICDYLLFSRQWTPGRLRQAGFRAQRVKSRLRFRSVKTMDDYAEVLYLRREAYVGAGKRPETTRPEDMADKLDGQSRILMAHHQDNLVGTLTFTFPNSEAVMLDSQTGFPNGHYPVRIPPKISLIEVSRLCIQEEYRSTDLLQGLFEYGVKHFLMSDRQWLLTSAVSDLLPLYKRIGFKTVGAAYKHPRLNNLEHHLILAHRDAFLWGKGMNLMVWTTLFGELIRHLLGRGLVQAPLFLRAVIRAKLWFAPVSRLLVDGRAAKAFQRHLDALRRERIKSSAILPQAASETVPLSASGGAPADSGSAGSPALAASADPAGSAHKAA